MTGAVRVDRVVAAIGTVLGERLANRHLDAFGPEARLVEDLALDSLMMMNLLLYLETDHGLRAPEHLVATRAATTVGALAEAFVAGDPQGGPIAAPPATPTAPASVPRAGAQEAALRQGVHGALSVDIKVHCYASCLADALKRVPGIDHRPLFFGVWDAPFSCDHAGLRYHVPGMTQDWLRPWAERLYDLTIRPLPAPGRDPQEEVRRLRHRLAARTPGEDVMVMLDMAQLPERKSAGDRTTFLHYLLLETVDDTDAWLMRDVDYRWEGRIACDRIGAAIAQPGVDGGAVIDRARVRPPRRSDLCAYFEARMAQRGNRLVAALRRLLERHGASGEAPLGHLEAAVADLPILLVRKYAYEHAFAFFWRDLQLDNASFDHWCDAIEGLVRELRTVHYDCVRLSRGGEAGLLSRLHAALERIECREREIGDALQHAYRRWRTAGVAA